VRRNRLSDFVQINKNGKIAMKLDDGDAIIGVALCRPDNDVVLTTSNARSVRFSAGEVRVFAGRDSTGVRGIRLAEDDHVISMAILQGDDASPQERAAFLKQRSRRGPLEAAPDLAEEDDDDDEVAGAAEATLSVERYAYLSAVEEMLLTVTSTGFGKQTSSHRYRRTRRAASGFDVHNLAKAGGGKLVASMPVEEDDNLLLISDLGQIIRVAVRQIPEWSRKTKGVRIFRPAEDEHVVSVERIEGGGDGGADEAAPDDDAAPDENDGAGQA
jgi:DNA gyrase subunit A